VIGQGVETGTWSSLIGGTRGLERVVCVGDLGLSVAKLGNGTKKTFEQTTNTAQSVLKSLFKSETK
jgi:hypothetical protein